MKVSHVLVSKICVCVSSAAPFQFSGRSSSGEKAIYEIVAHLKFSKLAQSRMNKYHKSNRKINFAKWKKTQTKHTPMLSLNVSVEFSAHIRLRKHWAEINRARNVKHTEKLKRKKLKKIWNTYAKTTCQRNSLQLIRFHLNSVFCLFISVFMLSLRWACLMFTILSRIHGELVFSQSVIILITAATTKTKCGINNETLGAVLSAVFSSLLLLKRARACVWAQRKMTHSEGEFFFWSAQK